MHYPNQPCLTYSARWEGQQPSINPDGADDRSNEGEEEKKQRAYAQVFVGSLSLLLGGLMALMLRSHGEAPLWLVSELSAVLCLLFYLRAPVTQNLTSGAVVPVEALVFSFPLVFGAGLLTVAVDPLAGVLVMGADVACMGAFFELCLGEYVRYNKLPASANR